MKKTVFHFQTFWIIFAFILLSSIGLSGVTIAFDLTKAETAGNADWTIGSSPNWTGGYSDFGSSLRSLGYTTITLTGSTITTSMLTNVKVLVIPEPQNSFSATERNVILNFVQNGGGLFLIADHDGSDRNNNGWDSRRVYNESLNTQTNFGISFDANSLYADPTTLFENPITQLTNGLTQVGMYAGCSITASGTTTTRIWLRNNNEEGLVTNTYGQGRIAAYGDSSPFDDGTGNSGNDLHNGWDEYSNAQMGINVVQWLAGQNTSNISFSAPVFIPSQPITNQPIEVRVSIQSTQALSFAYFYWKIDGGFNPVLMSLISGNTYKATIPAQANPTTVSYYIQARTTSNFVAYYPENAPTTLASFIISPTSNDENVITCPFTSIYPNPVSLSKHKVTIKTLPKTEIRIYDSKGRLVKSIYSKEELTEWDGNDKNNKSCPPGIYYIKLNNPAKHQKLQLSIMH